MNDQADVKIYSNLDTNFLKLVAIVTMAIDHTGAILFPEIGLFRMIGRIAFPIFAYCTVVGCLYTHDIKKYLLRLSLFAVISQPIYVLANNDTPADMIANLFVWNIFATLIVGVFAIYGFMSNKWWISAVALLAMTLFNFDYGIFGIILMLLFYFFRKKPALSAIFVTIHLALSFVGPPEYFQFGLPFMVQGLSVLAVPFLYIKTNFNPKINKYFFYAFYPAHLLVLFLLKLVLR